MRLLFCLMLLPSMAWAQDEEMKSHPDWKAFTEARQGECVGRPGTIDKPVDISVGGRSYRLEGHRLVQTDKDKDKILRIGVISATKDEREETLAAIGTLQSWMMKQKVDVIVLNGDIATHDFYMEEKLLPKLAEPDVLVIAHVGNTESCGQFNIAAAKMFASKKNFINGNWVREIELDDGVIYTLPGYHDRAFVHSGGAAKYDDEDLRDLKHLMKKQNAPKVLVAHGPPKMKGKKGIDVASGAGHVGDPKMTDLIEASGVRFGIFGHILEAGGRGSDLRGKKARKKKKWHKSLFVNAGTANPDPWSMLDDSTAYGMGLIFEMKGTKARYRVKRLAEPRL